MNDQKESAALSELRRCLPDHHMSYLFFCNMNMMQSIPPSPHASAAKSEVEQLQEQLDEMEVPEDAVD